MILRRIRHLQIPVFQKFLLIFLIAASLRLFLLVTVPTTWVSNHLGVQAHNDELSHVNYIRFLMKSGRLPVQKHHCQAPDAFLRNEFEYYQPPLYYAVVAIFALLFDVSAEGIAIVYFGRFVSMFFGMSSLLFLFLVMRERYGDRTALISLWLASLLPIHVRHSVSVGNDPAVWMFATILLWMISRRFGKKDIFFKSVGLEAIVVGLAVLSKANILPLLGMYVLMAILQREEWKNWLLPPVIGLFIASPYFLRNYYIYGDPMGINISAGPRQIALSSFQFQIWYRFIRSFFESFFLPYDRIFSRFLVRLPGYLLWITMVVFWLNLVFVKIREYRIRLAPTYEQAMIVALLMFGLAMIMFNWNYRQCESRIIFPIFPALFLCVGDLISKLSWKKIAIISAGLIYPYIIMNLAFEGTLEQLEAIYN